MVLYQEIISGSTAYPTAPSMTTLGASGSMTYSWEPHFHTYRALGPSGADMMISFDGKNDHGRMPATGGADIIVPFTLNVSYKSVWIRSIAGVTASIGCGFYTRQ